jgi:tetratricopeptide (TPR) repeat protein
LQSQLAISGHDYRLTANLGALHLQLGQIEAAMDCCAQAIAIDPYAHVAYYNRFLVHLSLGSLPSARRELHKALSCLYVLRGF